MKEKAIQNTLSVIAVTLILFLLTNDVCFSQGTFRDSIWYANFVKHSDGSLCNHIAPTATFVCYLNGDQSRTLTENAARWGLSPDPNIDGKGVFGVELGNFINPSLKVGDSVFVRFTCSANGEQEVLSDVVNNIPPVRFPLFLKLTKKNIPQQLENLTISFSPEKHRVLQWDSISGVTYTVYRRNFSDTLSNGKSRGLYELLASNLTTTAYVDSLPFTSYYHGYIVFAISSGGVYSAASSEVTEPDTNRFQLSVIPSATTVTLSWSSITDSNHVVRGYNIYKRTENSTYGQPIGYSGLDTSFIVSRLPLGTKFFYKVKGRIDAAKEIGESNEIAATTLTSRDGFYTYANLKVAVVIYMNTNRGSISDAEVVKIRKMLEVGRLFYWRNSLMKLNTPFTYYLIDTYKDFPSRDDYAVSRTANDLQALGVMNTQYDIVFRISPATSGYWSFGVLNLNLPGPARSTGFSHSEWPVGTGVQFPAYQPGINFGLTWIYIHEVQHALDGLYEANGQPQMYHGDQPHEFPVPAGEQLDFQAKMFRDFTGYERLLPQWGGIQEAIDGDKDGFPDNEPLLPLDEVRFGSSAFQVDTDGDGYTDRQEALDGIYNGSNPNNSDTDGDSISDGNDPYPRYPVNTPVPIFTPTIDGVIESGWHLANDTISFSPINYEPKIYINYDDNYLYIGFNLSYPGIPQLQLDFGANGWWWGTGNTIMTINPSQGQFTEFHTWDASPEVQAYALSLNQYGGMWDDNAVYQQKFSRRVIDPSSTILKVNYSNTVSQIEMAIPKSDYGGLTLTSGSKIGLNITYSNVKYVPAFWASTFDRYSFVNFVVDKPVGVEEQNRQEGIVSTFSLDQNYPNPFNPETVISYQLPVNGFVSLKIFDLLGREVTTLVNERKDAGKYSVEWKGVNQPSGVYLYHLQVGSFHETRKMILLR
ncbi:MAG: hypothetical protein A2455_11975 [Ignavibacteria bacterium RIFOXYC2_FULL_35_16]|nr:MAG: hypothetical protein A2X60_06205 [Ignavibacteria bacterium GWF2_35_20]OGU87811.1 MAG: hypothetical protein A2492_12625 [Ignavibacteria bacterium RIFOXYC12_FULL_35_11]OGU90895.1 MAG: hypothetical protein A3K31_08000 [Ignavibacteria bacterium RIFOXYA12_FULL_35_25]OGU96334.1 MAG: hypothetical protein A2347_05200 [Ignavibacteria bacterium RIFOXYB12_FULL_35_14]OGV01502.1 MAG: hypothetical protein A2455_11975 [Ignavibacteria bacterium RIFOXYC2_FULL_35_16]OGV31497.1 MAG: hypothetical protein 